MPARSRVYKRKPPETEPSPIPTRGRLPRQFPVPETAPPPVPSSALEGLAGQQTGRQQSLLQRISATLRGPVYPGPSIAERIFGDTSIYPGPSLADQFLGAPAGAPSAPFTQADLTTGTGVTQVSLPGIGGGPEARIARRGGPQQLEGRRFFTIVSAITRGVRPPLITFEAQQYLGYSHDDMKDRLGYELTAGGWVRRPVTGTVVDAYLGGAGTGDGVVDFTLPSLPTYGGGSQRLSRSGLINWRI